MSTHLKSFFLFACLGFLPELSSLAQSSFTEPPIATNTINAVKLSELNLTSNDYTLMETITETSIISVEHSKRGFTIASEDEDFMLKYKYVKEKEDGRTQWYIDLEDWSGVVKLGYLSNDVDVYTPKRPADVAKKLAVYRLINVAQQSGADGIVEPVISMNMAKNGKLYFYKTTVTGRMIKLKSN